MAASYFQAPRRSDRTKQPVHVTFRRAIGSDLLGDVALTIEDQHGRMADVRFSSAPKTWKTRETIERSVKFGLYESVRLTADNPDAFVEVVGGSGRVGVLHDFRPTLTIPICPTRPYTPERAVPTAVERHSGIVSGLCITRIDPSALFAVTHEPSGYAVAHADNRDTARHILKAMRPLLPWEELTTAEAVMALAPKGSAKFAEIRDAIDAARRAA